MADDWARENASRGVPLHEMVPPDRADRAPISEPLRVLLRAVARGPEAMATPECVEAYSDLVSRLGPDMRMLPATEQRLRMTLGRTEWDRLVAMFRRPYRPRPSEWSLYYPEGTVTFAPRKDET